MFPKLRASIGTPLPATKIDAPGIRPVHTNSSKYWWARFNRFVENPVSLAKITLSSPVFFFEFDI